MRESCGRLACTPGRGQGSGAAWVWQRAGLSLPGASLGLQVQSQHTKLSGLDILIINPPSDAGALCYVVSPQRSVAVEHPLQISRHSSCKGQAQLHSAGKKYRLMCCSNLSSCGCRNLFSNCGTCANWPASSPQAYLSFCTATGATESLQGDWQCMVKTSSPFLEPTLEYALPMPHSTLRSD